MASNRLNLQIGGGNPEEYEKRKVMREVARAQHQVEDIADIFIDNLIEEVEKSCPPGHYFCFDDQKCKKIPSGHKVKDNGELIKEEVVQREPVSNVDVLSNYISKTVKEEVKPYNPRSARETVSLEERIQLLEKDVFTQMAQSTPNTLVSGIGASLDSGGGAVWLWDLEDVEIGAPLDGQYPDITDGSFIAYNAAKQRWEPVEESDAANILSGGVIKSTGGSANTSGNLVIESTNATNGNLTFQYQEQAGPVETIVFDGNSGDTRFKGGHVVIERRIGSTIGASTFTIQGRVTNAPNDPVGILFSTYNSHPMDNGTADSIRYEGRVNNNKDIATKEYVDSKIVDPGGSFVFKGNCNVNLSPAANTPPVEQGVGYFYINTVAGTAVAAWPGIGTLPIAEDQLIIWSEAESRWFAGAVENDTTFVKVDGSNQMTGQLTVNIPSDAESNSAVNIKQGGTTHAQIFSGGSATFNAVTCTNISSFNVKPQTDDTYVLGDSTKSW